jgi:hypothetical protein
MQRSAENLSPLDRRVCRKWLGVVLALYGALIIVTVRIAVGNQLSKNQARDPVAAASERPSAHIGATPIRQPISAFRTSPVQMTMSSVLEYWPPRLAAFFISSQVCDVAPSYVPTKC